MEEPIENKHPELAARIEVLNLAVWALLISLREPQKAQFRALLERNIENWRVNHMASPRSDRFLEQFEEEAAVLLEVLR